MIISCIILLIVIYTLLIKCTFYNNSKNIISEIQKCISYTYFLGKKCKKNTIKFNSVKSTLEILSVKNTTLNLMYKPYSTNNILKYNLYCLYQFNCYIKEIYRYYINSIDIKV